MTGYTLLYIDYFESEKEYNINELVDIINTNSKSVGEFSIYKVNEDISNLISYKLIVLKTINEEDKGV